MNDRIRSLLNQISALEDEMRIALHEQETKMFFEIKGRRIEFEAAVKQTHRKLKLNFFVWLVSNRPQNLITGPIIYGMIFPLLILDFFVTFYQATCFPVYGVAKVRRRDYIVLDRQYLGYLNFIEKFHCTYCAYGSGLTAYICEIVARTEQYFCPIKHARKILGTTRRYADFLQYGDAADYEKKLEEYRVALGEKS
ncbi:MAG TPA: hypothetical protein VF928_03400 [Usitatibacteraceae bacterium]